MFRLWWCKCSDYDDTDVQIMMMQMFRLWWYRCVEYDDAEYKHIFHKGSLTDGGDGLYGPNNCPGVYLYNGKKHLSRFYYYRRKATEYLLPSKKKKSN